MQQPGCMQILFSDSTLQLLPLGWTAKFKSGPTPCNKICHYPTLDPLSLACVGGVAHVTIGYSALFLYTASKKVTVLIENEANANI